MRAFIADSFSQVAKTVSVHGFVDVRPSKMNS
jgi:hypothetical protein